MKKAKQKRWMNSSKTEKRRNKLNRNAIKKNRSAANT